MRILVTGGNGFIGSYLVNSLIQDNHDVFSSSRTNPKKLENLRRGIKFFKCDFKDSESIKSMLKHVEPEAIYHLSSQSNIPDSWNNPLQTFKINVDGTITLLEEAKNSKTEPKIHIVCSSAEYGSVDSNDIPIHEDVKFRPSSPYAVSKISMDMLGYSYWRSYGMKITRSRPFAIVGPGKSADVLTQWSQNIVEIEIGEKENLMVGNLNAIRDYLDVRDSVSALKTIVSKGKSGQVYNICSSEGLKLKRIIEILKSLCKKKFKIKEDPNRLRPSDDPVLIGDNKKLINLDWKPQFQIESSIKDTLEYWRKIMSN